MQVLFSNGTTIKEVNDEFRKHFPYLKLEFFFSDYLPGQTSLWDQKLSQATRIDKITGITLPVQIEFSRCDTVACFEQEKQNKTGLFVKVFRKLNNEWIGTGNMNHLGLEKLNLLGKADFRYKYNYNTLFL